MQGKVAGLTISDASGLNEIVVTALGISRKYALGSVINVIRGATNLQDYNQPLVILDGEIYTGDLKNISTSKITEAMVLKGADASALYGSRGAQGVLIISTKGPIIIPKAEEPIIKVRKNFNETAFFFPQIHADQNGYYSFNFTMPETATKWNWKILAHTQKTKFAYLEKQLQTQLNLMVQPNIPRLLYQGDKIKLQSLITNLDTVSIRGNITCKIEDAVTGQDITSQLAGSTDQVFSLNKKSSGAISFLLNVPAHQLNPLKIIITALSAGVTDAEEHIIPVLSSRVFTRQSMPVRFDEQQTITLSPVKLPVNASLYGLGISITQKPQTSLIYALPGLANYSYDCAEQTFNKLRAHVTALRLMQKDTEAQRAFKKAAAFIDQNKSKEEQLPDELAAETMPWMSIGNHTVHQQKLLFRLLDTSVTKSSIYKHLQRLYTLQQPDGGLAWFEGGKSNAYISAYVLAGFGQLKKQGWISAAYAANQQQDFISRLFKFLEAGCLSSSKETYDSFQLYAMSYWIKDMDTTKALSQKINSILNAESVDVNNKSLERQALFIINVFRYTSLGALHQKALNQLKNIRELAIQDERNGTRWKDLSDSEKLSNSAEETMALLAEAFELSGDYKEIPANMIKWLLTVRQGEHWQTTKAVAAAITMLQKEKEGSLGKTKAFSVKVEEGNLSVSDELLNGIPAAFTRVKQLPQAITLQQQGSGANGALTWYYFAEPLKLDTLNKAIRISKQFYSYDKDKGWIKFNPDNVLKVGDQLRVKLTIETSSRLKFVHISDPRAAAFEFKDKKSGYQYMNGSSYYKSVKDKGLELFTEEVPKGISELTYELVVEHAGEFTSGPVILQCMYNPSLTAYSDVEKIKTE